MFELKFFNGRKVVSFSVFDSKQWINLEAKTDLLGKDAQIAATFGNGKMKIYIDGREAASKDVADAQFTASAAPLSIAEYDKETHSRFAGAVKNSA